MAVCQFLKEVSSDFLFMYARLNVIVMSSRCVVLFGPFHVRRMELVSRS